MENQIQNLRPLISDLYKEVNGCRPTVEMLNYYKGLSDDELDKLFQKWLEELTEKQDMEYLQEQKAFKDFDKKVQKMLDMGAQDRTTALRWLFDDCQEEIEGGDDTKRVPDVFEIEHQLWLMRISPTFGKGRELLEEIVKAFY